MKAHIAVPSLLFALVACNAPPAPIDVGDVTWSRDVLPITQARCAACHQEGGIAPFSLETYSEAKLMAGAMAAATASGDMPPWMPANGCNTFRDDRSLSARDIAVFQAWAEQGAPQGDPVDATTPPLPALETVDLRLVSKEPYTPPSNVADDFHCFVLDPALPEVRNLIGYEVTPGARKMLHHLILYAMPRAIAQAKDAADPSPGYKCSTASGVGDGSVVGTWVPGTGVVHFPEGTGVAIGPGDALVMEMHYNLANGAQPDASALALQFARGPVTLAKFLPLADQGFSVPPRTMGYTPESQPKMATLPFSGKIWGVLPHMHLRGQKLRSQLDDTCLLDVQRYDYHWQEMFMFAKPVHFAKGARAKLTCTWNNDLDKPLVWGEGTDNEMCLSVAYVTPD